MSTVILSAIYSLRNYLQREEGESIVEYVLIVTFLSIAVISSLALLEMN